MYFVFLLTLTMQCIRHFLCLCAVSIPSDMSHCHIALVSRLLGVVTICVVSLTTHSSLFNPLPTPIFHFLTLTLMHFSARHACSFIHSAQLPTLSRISSSLQAAGWRFNIADWGGGMSVGCTVCRGWPHSVLWYHYLMPFSWHSQDYEVFLVTSLPRVSSVLSSAWLFPLNSSLNLVRQPGALHF